MADGKYITYGMPLPVSGGGAPGTNSFALNGATDKYEVIFQPVEAMTITRLFVRIGALAGTVPTYRIGLQGVGADGNPDGTFKGGGSPASATFTPSGAGTVNEVALANDYACARGESLAFVMEPTGTPDGSNNASVTANLTNVLQSDVPYGISNDAGSRTRSSNVPCFGYGSATKVYGLPVGAFGTTTINSGGTAEAALKFTIPADWTGTYQILGVRFQKGTWIAARTVNLKLYQGGAAGDTTVLQDVSWDTDAIASLTASNFLTLWFDESSLATLTAGDTCRVGISTPDASNQILRHMTVDSAAYWDAFEGGQDFAFSSRSGGNWTDDATKRLIAELIFADLTKPAGGSGGLSAYVIGG